MVKKNKHVTVKNDKDRIKLEFDTMFYVTAVRREVPPPTKVEMPKKGKGSYNRKEKHKGRFHYNSDGFSPYFCNKACSFFGEY